MAAIEEEGSEVFTLGQCLRSEDQKPLRPLHISLNFTAALQIKNYYSCFIVGETEVQKSDFPKVTQYFQISTILGHKMGGKPQSSRSFK